MGRAAVPRGPLSVALCPGGPERGSPLYRLQKTKRGTQRFRPLAQGFSILRCRRSNTSLRGQALATSSLTAVFDHVSLHHRGVQSILCACSCHPHLALLLFPRHLAGPALQLHASAEPPFTLLAGPDVCPRTLSVVPGPVLVPLVTCLCWLLHLTMSFVAMSFCFLTSVGFLVVAWCLLHSRSSCKGLREPIGLFFQNLLNDL